METTNTQTQSTQHTEQEQAAARFTPIYLDSIRVDSILDFDLYLKVNQTLVLYRSADLPFTERTRQKLLENRVERLFIANKSQEKYQRYIERNLGTILKDPSIQQEKKAGILYQTSTGLARSAGKPYLWREHQAIQGDGGASAGVHPAGTGSFS